MGPLYQKFDNYRGHRERADSDYNYVVINLIISGEVLIIIIYMSTYYS